MNKNQLVLKIFSFLVFVGTFLPVKVLAQCATDVNYGQNLVVNGDFSNGYSNWAFTPQTIGWTGDPPATQADGYRIHGAPSLPGDILVGTNPNAQFNAGFQTFGDHTTGSGNFLMVDGVCKLGVKLFTQSVNVVPTTNYYFSVWINSLKDNPTNPGVLNFDVGGNNIGANIVAPALGGGSAGGAWVKYEVVWNSGATSGNVIISIENQNTASCSNQVDFAIDDIAFIPGCSYGAPGPQPDLGPDQSLCGKGGSITLDANVPHKTTTTVSWSSNSPGTLSGTGLGAPYTKTITAPGTYSVCVTDNGSCVKSDVIVISNTFSINIGGPYVLCATNSQVLDAGFTGIGVTYQWYKNGSLVPYPNDTKTYTATSAGTYRVDVTVPGCGTQSSTATITSTNPITPIDVYYCATSGPVSGVTLQGSGTGSAGYTWFAAATGGSSLGSGASYVLPTIPQGTTATQIFYVQDNTATSGTAGTTTLNTTNLNTVTSWSQAFDIVGDVTVNSLQVPFTSYYSPPAGFPGFTITVEVLNASGASFSPAQTYTSGTSLETIPGNDGGNRRLYTFPFTGFTISSSLGTSLRLKLTAHSHPNGAPLANQSGAGFTYPMASTPNSAITITGALNNGSPAVAQSGGYSYFYNWNISSKFSCSRTPVRAINNCPQPVTWTTFYLVPQADGSCKIVWGTAKEFNNQYFSIERSSDGVHFESIGTVSGAGNRDYASNYYFTDEAPLEGTSYYRITQHDLDGTFSSTEMKPYNSNGLTQISTFPNPYQQTTTLLVSGGNEVPYTYTIYSVSGQLVETGTANYNVPVSIGGNLAKGMYMLTVTNEVEKITTKIVKQ